jgi:hypothetical protein
MLQSNNPYSPGAGRKPAALVGRDKQIELWESELLRIESGLDSRPMALYGLRGVGKTVLLSRLHEMALGRGWLSARMEPNSRKTLREILYSEFESKLVEIASPRAGERVRRALKTALSFRASVGLPGLASFGIDLSGVSGSNANTGNISGDFQRYVKDLSAACEELGTGVSILIDEAQDLSIEDMETVSETIHRATQDGLRLVVALAGLPTLPGALAKAKSYAERLYHYHRIEKLSPADALTALTEPAKSKGALWEGPAANEIVRISDGYPYFLQEYGSACWLAAAESPIRMRDVKKAAPNAEKQLDDGFFRARWDRLSDAQKGYMRAMALCGDDEIYTKDISKKLGLPAPALSQRRADLIKKGLIYAPRQGVVTFSVPLMAQFIRRVFDPQDL